MAFLFQHPKSRYWIAGWKDEHGKRINRSTRIIAKETKQSRKEAPRIADEYESATLKARSAKQVRQTLAALQKRSWATISQSPPLPNTRIASPISRKARLARRGSSNTV